MADTQEMENEEEQSSDSSFDEDFEEDVDPRVQGELESLNAASEEINKLETEIEKAKTKFKGRLKDSGLKLNILHKKLGRCVNKCRPYYELLKQSRMAQLEAQKAAVNYQRANQVYEAAKETVALAEKKIMDSQGEKREFDSAWQEMLNHATIKFMASEKEKASNQEEHMKKASEHALTEAKLRVLEKDLPHSIARSRPYFDLKERLEYVLQLERQSIDSLQQALKAAKDRYKGSLEKLEAISEEIHMQRRLKLKLPPRTPGVGAEKNDESLDLPSITLDMKSETSSFVSYDDDADSLVLCSNEGPQNWRRHQRSVSQDWAGSSFPLPQNGTDNKIIPAGPGENPSAGLRQGSQKNPCVNPSSVQQEGRPRTKFRRKSEASAPPKNSIDSNALSPHDEVLAERGSPSGASEKDLPAMNHQEQATVTCHEISVEKQMEHMEKVELQYESRVGTGLSVEMAKLEIKQKQQPRATPAPKTLKTHQSLRDDAKRSASATPPLHSHRSKSASRTPSQAFPILVGLSQCNMQSSPKLPQAKNSNTSASGYNSNWHSQSQNNSNYFLPANQHQYPRN